MNIDFYKGKKVFLTGHTGFKGSWMSHLLIDAGSEVVGYSLEPNTQPNLFTLLGLEKRMTSNIGDIRNLDLLQKAMNHAEPDIVIHMAAQPLVGESYENPVYTYETNVMGTVNVLESVRHCPTVRSVVNVTTDKVYKNNEWVWGYRETDELNGYDPYSNSKSCSELVTDSYVKSFFNEKKVSVSTCRAGNVIGGGDFSADRIIPDCVRAGSAKEDIIVRNPYSTRPYQHVIEPIFAYLMVAEKQYNNQGEYQGNYNIGPDDCDCVETGKLVDLFCASWKENLKWIDQSQAEAHHEANFLKLDCSLAKKVFQWKPGWHIEDAIEKTVEWEKLRIAGAKQEELIEITTKQIKEYLGA